MKYYLLFFICVITSCSKNDSLKDNFINGDDYWAYYDEGNPGFHGIYFRFNVNGKSDRYCEDSSTLKICKGSDVIDSNVPWNISSDSIFNWGGNKYYIINCNESVIVLYAKGKTSRHFFLIKEFPGKLRKGKMYYENILKLKELN